MARPCKSVDVMSKHLTKEEKKIKKEAEEKLKGGTNKIKPPTYLNKNQKNIFKYIVKELKETNILTNLDIYVLSNCAISVDRIQEAEKLLNEDILNKEALRLKESYIKDLFREMNELCLSPQSRAKMANLNIAAQENKEDPVLKALAGDI